MGPRAIHAVASQISKVVMDCPPVHPVLCSGMLFGLSLPLILGHVLYNLVHTSRNSTLASQGLLFMVKRPGQWIVVGKNSRVRASASAANTATRQIGRICKAQIPRGRTGTWVDFRSRHLVTEVPAETEEANPRILVNSSVTDLIFKETLLSISTMVIILPIGSLDLV